MPYIRQGQVRPAKRDRPWVFAGAVCLAAVAGYVNVIVLSFFDVPVSHMTGAVSKIGIDIAAGDVLDLRLTASILIGFVLGAILSGVLIGGRTVASGRRYGVALMVEGVLFAVAGVLLIGGSRSGVPIAAVGCGVQNAMASSYYGLVIRTTHVTGIVTDMGVMIGHWIRHRRIRVWKLMLLTLILTGFFAGGLGGAIAVGRLAAHSLLVASAVCIIAGGVYFGWRHLGSPGSSSPVPLPEPPARAGEMRP